MTRLALPSFRLHIGENRTGGTRQYLDRFTAAGTLCIHVVASVEHAQKAIDAGIDTLVAVGGEAGGHPPTSLVSA